MRPDPVAAAEAGLGLAAVAGLPFLILRPSRIMSGTPVRTMQAAGWMFWILAAALAALRVLWPVDR